METETPKEETISNESPKSVVEVATELRDDIRKERELLQQERQKLEALRAEQVLSGRADAGEQPPQQKEETPAEYTKRIQEEIRNRTLK